ncbi:hypothetical protein LTR10_013168 [Elasticomyces elasticus]|uniref:Uncharacterized protein n=1 Tax=Exophiala sideris TaxID=1016849 RepID=A0ABR0JAX9_9EURO|nr:hypothetical protein LTR10_013168 [Elasticomyces elasticus]KAK5030543.1 hypothetical protein LTS07_005327 [Exophiala sideris]KAK5038597.1 hypothetical protein LTR13_004344 [Exophiala sideris]KAK5060478.1 hypothetical protein LTR69_005795 [Exophiala sideris]KAK5183390.1 hypothetical protein LTR44_004391 [Eurotiomycetes sp. CCFEE 6388]
MKRTFDPGGQAAAHARDVPVDLQAAHDIGHAIITGARPMFFISQGLLYQTVPGRPAIRLPNDHPIMQRASRPNLPSTSYAHLPHYTAGVWPASSQASNTSFHAAEPLTYPQASTALGLQQHVNTGNVQPHPIANPALVQGPRASDPAQFRGFPPAQPGQLAVTVPPSRAKRLSEEDNVSHTLLAPANKRPRHFPKPAEPRQNRIAGVNQQIVHPPRDSIDAFQFDHIDDEAPPLTNVANSCTNVIGTTSNNPIRSEHDSQIATESAEKIAVVDEISLAELTKYKDAGLPGSVHVVFDADQRNKILFLASHGIPCRAIAYVLQIDTGIEVRRLDRLSRNGDIIAHYLPQIIKEADWKEGPETIVSDLFSRAESNAWMPRILQQARDYIDTAAMDAGRGRDERRKYARERKFLREWRERISREADPAAVARRNRRIEHEVEEALAREEADKQRLHDLGYRRDKPEVEKALMSQWLLFLRNKGQLPGLLEADGVVE